MLISASEWGTSENNKHIGRHFALQIHIDLILDKVKNDRFSEFHDLAPRWSIIFFSFQGSKELTSLDMKIFLIALQNYFTSMPSDYILFFVIVSDTDCGLVDKIWDYYELGHAFESSALTVFLFYNSKVFYDLISIYRHLRSLGRLKVLIRVVISEFNMALRKNFT